MTLLSHSTPYVWKLVRQPGQARSPLPSPVVSLQVPGMPGPQWNTPKWVLRPLIVSMMSISPMLGQLVAPTGRAGAPIAQNAGQ